MATTLASLRDRVETVLQDTGNLIYATGDVDEGIGQALAEYNLVLGKASTIKDWDGATATTFDAAHEGPLVTAAAAYAAGTRSQERMESTSLVQTVPAGIENWSANRLGVWRQILEQLRIKGLLAGAKPWQDAADRWTIPDEDA